MNCEFFEGSNLTFAPCLPLKTKLKQDQFTVNKNSINSKPLEAIRIDNTYNEVIKCNTEK